MKIHTMDDYVNRNFSNGHVLSGRPQQNEDTSYPGLGKFSMYPEHVRLVRQRSSGLYNRHGFHHKSAITLITELGSESNAHGLAKIVTSSDTKRKVIWALMVIIGFTAATLQLSLLVRKYLQFQVVELSEIKDSMPVEFPAVTVCNIEPISWRKLRILFTRPEGNELVHWLEFTQRFQFGEQHPHLTSIRAFYENLGEEATNISHNLQDFMVHCQFNKQICSLPNFTTSFDGNYFNCFTFNGGQNNKTLLMHTTGPENGLSLIVSLDNDEPPLGSYGVYNIDSNIMHSAGVRVVIHAPNTMPSPVDHGFDIPPGYSSSVSLKANLHTRLSEPYGNCTTDTLAGSNYTNTFFSCLQVCKQRIIVDRCKCKSSALPGVSTEFTFCGKINNWKAILAGQAGYKENDTVPIRSLACEERVQKELANDRSYEITCQCYQPCREMKYQKSVSHSYWPLEYYQLHALQMFYGSNIQQNFMYEAYTYLSDLSNISMLLSKRNMNNSRTQDLLEASYTLSEKERIQRASSLIRQNLLRLNIYMEDLSVVEYRQLPAYGLADLFADIGGTLGLWMGISVLTIMELMELIIRLFFLLFNSETKPPRFQDDEQDCVDRYSMLPSNNMAHKFQKDFVEASSFDFKLQTESAA